jgi:Ran GTPase-activating protein (RanGAP) involved in mRNA processing and transport
MQPRGKQRLGQLSDFEQRSSQTAETTRSRQQVLELFDEPSDDDVDSTTSVEQQSVDSDDGSRDEANASRAPKGAQPTNVVHARKRKSKRHVCRYCRKVFRI